MTCRYGNNDADSDAGSYSNSCLTIVVGCEQARVLESAIHYKHMLEIW